MCDRDSGINGNAHRRTPHGTNAKIGTIGNPATPSRAHILATPATAGNMLALARDAGIHAVQKTCAPAQTRDAGKNGNLRQLLARPQPRSPAKTATVSRSLLSRRGVGGEVTMRTRKSGH